MFKTLKDAFERLLGKKAGGNTTATSPPANATRSDSVGRPQASSQRKSEYVKPPPVPPGGLKVPIRDVAKDFDISRGPPGSSSTSGGTPSKTTASRGKSPPPYVPPPAVPRGELPISIRDTVRDFEIEESKWRPAKPQPRKPDSTPPNPTPTEPRVIQRPSAQPSTVVTQRKVDGPLPAPWVSEGRRLQLIEDSAVKKTVVVRLGIDFGTAFSKLAVRVGQSVYVVDWSGLTSIEQAHLLPSEITQDPNGSFLVTETDQGGVTSSYLKKPFVEGTSPDIETMVRVTAYIAWLLIYARAWIYKHLSSLIVDRKIIWEVNVGVPTGSWGDGFAGRQPLLSTLRAAWMVSQSASINSDTVHKALRQANDLRKGGLPDIYLVPEVAAQIAGYRNSPARQDGMHMLVDIGAGTVDIAIFRLMIDAETQSDQIVVFDTDVCALGTAFLMRALTDGSHGRLAWRPSQKVPSKQDLISSSALSSARYDELVMPLFDKLCRRIAAVMEGGRSNDPRASEFNRGDKDVLRIFLSGGGCRVPLYTDAASAAVKNIRSYQQRLPQQPKIVSILPLDDEGFDRVSVAIGLTHSIEDIKLIEPNAIRRPEPLPKASSRLDRDDLYPK